MDDKSKPLDLTKEQEMKESDDDQQSSLRLHPEHIPVTRLSRKALIALGGGGALILSAATIFALQSGSGSGPRTELFTTDQKPSADALASLPEDYTQVPKLGPPLPGDLGGPILDAEAQYQLPPPAETAPPVDPSIAERERERQAALKSRLFGDSPQRNTEIPQNADEGSSQVTTAPPEPSEQLASSHGLQSLSNPYVLQSGSIISAALITGIRSDIAGQVTAQVTQNIYDSLTGRILLIPQGTKIIGRYDRDIGFGQRRIGLVWNRLILPNGKSLIFDELPGSDAQGFAGLQDGVDYHFDRLALAAGLSTILSVGAQAGSAGDSDISRAIRDGISDTAGRTGDEIVKRQLEVAPTLTIRPGFPLRVLVGKDLVLEPYGEG